MFRLIKALFKRLFTAFLIVIAALLIGGVIFAMSYIGIVLTIVCCLFVIAFILWDCLRPDKPDEDKVDE